MIDKGVLGYNLYCDICGILKMAFETFYDAVDYKKENGWISEKHKDEWQDICQECQEG